MNERGRVSLGGTPQMSALRHIGLAGPGSRGKTSPSAGLHSFAAVYVRRLQNPASILLPAGL